MCAKSKGFFGMRRGSTKSLTFQVVDGQQITKDRVSEVRNPKTQGQQVQRAIMATVTQAYSHMKAICDHSFEGESYGAHNQRKFVSENLRLIRQRLAAAGADYQNEKAFTPLGSNILACQPYIVSRGSLACSYSFDENLIRISGANSYQRVAEYFGAKQGDQLTFVIVDTDVDTMTAHFNFARIILQPVSATGEELPMSTPFLTEGLNLNMPNPKNVNNDVVRFDAEEGYGVVLGIVTVDDHFSAGVIRSAYEGTSWKRSSCTLEIPMDVEGYTLAEAIASAASHIDVDNPYYLNQADEVPSEV